METITINTYTFEELSEDAKEQAREEYRSLPYNDPYQSERHDAYIQAKGIYDQIRDIESGDNPLKGARLYTWIENNLSDIWTKACYISKHQKDGKTFFHSDWWNYKYDSVKVRMSQIKKANNIGECPLTGTCYDSMFLEALTDFMDNPKESIDQTDLIITESDHERIFQEDYDYSMSDHYINEHFEANEYIFTEDGKQFKY